jgi:hypothetical protein
MIAGDMEMEDIIEDNDASHIFPVLGDSSSWRQYFVI